MQSLLSFMTSCKTHVTKASQMSRSKIIGQDEGLSKRKKMPWHWHIYFLCQNLTHISCKFFVKKNEVIISQNNYLSLLIIVKIKTNNLEVGNHVNF